MLVEGKQKRECFGRLCTVAQEQQNCVDKVCLKRVRWCSKLNDSRGETVVRLTHLQLVHEFQKICALRVAGLADAAETLNKLAHGHSQKL